MLIIPSQLSTLKPGSTFIWWAEEGWGLYRKIRQDQNICIAEQLNAPGQTAAIPAQYWVATPREDFPAGEPLLAELFNSPLQTLKLKVTTPSMEPLLPVGSTIELTPPTAIPPRPGHIVTVARNNIWLTHRLLNIQSGELLITKGDALPHPDSPLPIFHLLGVVSAAKFNGQALPQNNLYSSVNTIFWKKKIELKFLAKKLAKTFIEKISN